jgi:hypothetical protein
MQRHAQKQLREDNDLLQQQIAHLQADNEGLSNRLAAAGVPEFFRTSK